MENIKSILYTRNLSGHRREYLEFASELLEGEQANARRLFKSSKPLLFLMIEDSLPLFFLAGIWRSLRGWRTAGLLFRPIPAAEAKTLRLKVKKLLLQILMRLPRVSVLSIVPAALDDRILTVSNDWIYDFQLWDITQERRLQYFKIKVLQDLTGLTDDERKVFTELDRLAGERYVVSALGRQDADKGFNRYVGFLKKNIALGKIHASVIGKIADGFEESVDFIRSNEGAIFNRYVSDNEILIGYAKSNAIWCAYAQSYDQASGILGRAVQFGVLPVVRSGSLSHKFCTVEKIKCETDDVTADNMVAAIQAYEKNAYAADLLIDRFKKVSMDKLRVALSL